ncbi:MAG: hypothetical protein ACI4IH_05335 [Eubacterium sp.]
MSNEELIRKLISDMDNYGYGSYFRQNLKFGIFILIAIAVYIIENLILLKAIKKKRLEEEYTQYKRKAFAGGSPLMFFCKSNKTFLTVKIIIWLIAVAVICVI